MREVVENGSRQDAPGAIRRRLVRVWEPLLIRLFRHLAEFFNKFLDMSSIRRAGTRSIKSFEQSARCRMQILGTPLKHGP